jgi:pimeloyl-ACP methyl ester carboxylesterase
MTKSQMAAESAPTRFLDRAEGRLAYDVQGQGHLVVCVPGMGDLRSSYRYLAPALVAAGYRVATMDLRGHGESDTTFAAFDDVAAGQDALALAEHLLPEGERAVLVGNSMGAGAAVWAAAERPELVAGLVLAGPFVRDGDVGALQRLLFALALRRPWGPAVWARYFRSLFPTAPPPDLREHVARIRASQRRPGAWAAFTATTRTTHEPAHERLGQVAVPTLVVMGTKDRDWPDPAAEARWVADALRAELLLVEGAGHYPHAEFPGEVAPAVLALLRHAFPDAPAHA